MLVKLVENLDDGTFEIMTSHVQKHELYTIHYMNMTTKCNSMEIIGQKQRPCKLHQNTVCYKYTLSPAAPSGGPGNSLLDSPAPKGASEPAVNAKIRPNSGGRTLWNMHRKTL